MLDNRVVVIRGMIGLALMDGVWTLAERVASRSFESWKSHKC